MTSLGVLQKKTDNWLWGNECKAVCSEKKGRYQLECSSADLQALENRELIEIMIYTCIVHAVVICEDSHERHQSADRVSKWTTKSSFCSVQDPLKRKYNRIFLKCFWPGCSDRNPRHTCPAQLVEHSTRHGQRSNGSFRLKTLVIF